MRKVLKFLGCTALVLLAIPVVMLVVGIAANLLGTEDFSKVGAFAIVVLMAIFALMVVRMVKGKRYSASAIDEDLEERRKVKAHWEEGYYPSTDGSGNRWDGLPE